MTSTEVLEYFKNRKSHLEGQHLKDYMTAKLIIISVLILAVLAGASIGWNNWTNRNDPQCPYSQAAIYIKTAKGAQTWTCVPYTITIEEVSNVST